MAKLLLALVRLHTVSRDDIEDLAELKASRAANLRAMAEDLAELKAGKATSLQALAADLAELKASQAVSQQAVVQDLAGQEVCQLARDIQSKIETQRFTTQSGPYFSTILAKYESKVCRIPRDSR